MARKKSPAEKAPQRMRSLPPYDPRPLARAIGRELRRYRREQKVTQPFMAQMMDLTLSTYRRLEAGRITQVGIDKLALYVGQYPASRRKAMWTQLFGGL